MLKTYVALLDRAPKKGADYGVIFPDFPGCVFAGKTLNDALENAREGLIFHIEGMMEEGESIPEPSSIDSVLKKFSHNQVIPALIHIMMPSGQIKRVNISMDTGLIAEIDHAAKLFGKTRSQFLAEAARRMVA